MTKYYIFSNENRCPKGWIKDTAYVGRTLYANGEGYGNSIGGSLSDPIHHTHSVPTVGVDYDYCYGPSYIVSTQSDYTLYKYISLVICYTEKDYFLRIFKKNSIIIVDNNTCPKGWSKIKTNLKTIVVTNKSPSEYYFDNTHTHHTSTSSRDYYPGSYAIIQRDVDTGQTNHQIDLAYVSVTLCKKN